jgi:hypothetical protein
MRPSAPLPTVAPWRRSRAPVCAALLLLLLGQGSSTAAQSQPRGPALNWVRLPGAESCIAPVELAERVEHRLERRVFVRMPDAIVVVEGQVAPAASGGFAAVVRVSDMQGNVYGARELALPDADCRRLDDVLALVIAVTIRGRGSSSGIALPPSIQAELDGLFGEESSELDPAALPPRAESEPNASTAPARDSPRQDGAEPQRAPPAPAPERGLQLGLGAGFTAVTGLQHDGTIGPAAHLRLGLPQIGSAVLSAAFGLSQEQVVSDAMRGDGTLIFQPVLLALALCGPDLNALSSFVALCAHVAIGQLRAEAVGFVENGSASEPWFELGPEASVRVPVLGPLYLRFLVRMAVRLGPPRFAYRRLDGDVSEAHRVSQLGVGGELALGVDLF